MQINFTREFAKQKDKASIKVQKALNSKLQLFIKNPYNRILNNHSLKGKLKLYRSIDITGDWRAWYKNEGEIIWFVAIGTHSQLYR